ncbi:MAG TPA: helix-turn-helix domain-containing protein [Polyangiaceae bacterium]|nr:helix-turn-helix domain-containing protein [Polyangiaceae bacterium]
MSARFQPKHVVAVVAFDGVVPFDLSTPCEVFGRARLGDGRAPYEVKVCGVRREVGAGAFSLRARCGLGGLHGAETVIVPGVDDVRRPVPPPLIRALRAAAARGARIASICSGAFVLAATGLLDGKRATTHWLAADELARRYPAIRVDPDVLYVDQGSVLTSAGAAAGLDLCLYLVRRDFGASAAAYAARCAVMPLEREGGQAQFIVHPPPATDGESLEPLLRWLEQNLNAELNLGAIARRAAMSTRSLSRHFREQIGTTPAQWVLRARVRRAQQLLEKTGHPVERVAGDVGFGSTAAFREHFRRVVGTSPRAYRAAFRPGGARR